MTGTKHGKPDLFNLVLKPYAQALHGARPVRTVQNEVLDMAFESGYGKGYQDDSSAALADGLGDEARDGYFRGKAESEKGD